MGGGHLESLINRLGGGKSHEGKPRREMLALGRQDKVWAMDRGDLGPLPRPPVSQPGHCCAPCMLSNVLSNVQHVLQAINMGRTSSLHAFQVFILKACG